MSSQIMACDLCTHFSRYHPHLLCHHSSPPPKVPGCRIHHVGRCSERRNLKPLMNILGQKRNCIELPLQGGILGICRVQGVRVRRSTVNATTEDTSDDCSQVSLHFAGVIYAEYHISFDCVGSEFGPFLTDFSSGSGGNPGKLDA
jgi:hypothetical protein